MNWRIFSRGYTFFPCHEFLCVRNRDTLNLFLEWGTPYEVAHFTQKIVRCEPYINNSTRNYIAWAKNILINYDQIKHRKGWIIHCDLSWFSSILKDSRCVWSHDTIVMSLNNLSHDLVVVVVWIQSDCLEMKQSKCTLQQSELLMKTWR